MKTKIAEKKIYENYPKDRVLIFGYCEIQNIERVLETCTRIYYNSGVYGWNFNAFCLKDLALITGYRVKRNESNDEKTKNRILELEKYLKENLKYYNFKEMTNYTLDVLNNLFK